ncbi:uncharacterized protein M6B38_195095 [Iris pallida]|uniref:Uncharacterized protein n=1 Tax=Iris pallida TaxID=29817 RepID=A0AAX6EDM7_IRIPA|nr:uncharacterized protein M6B38_195095 [Iris pallida]
MFVYIVSQHVHNESDLALLLYPSVLHQSFVHAWESLICSCSGDIHEYRFVVLKAILLLQL